MAEYKAQCFCGSVRLSVAGDPVLQCYCHCMTCRAFSGAAFTSVVLWPTEQVRFDDGQALVHRFRREDRPSFRLSCTACGGALGSELPHLAMTDIYAGLVPGFSFEPTYHINYEHAVFPIREVSQSSRICRSGQAGPV
ncbi:GFA family protein [Cognatishimia sp. F0-27]|uniref:GFA family protein n=1 Tax=Cognatishimia sp. F0-27 TaxID=2816855 RepID=UPI001D0C3955|nr:GFA family protein [Cognatishimia sp. F0-27]MCC1494996.1 GFA family protein [Cognatishimia sp. F0-27]